MNERSANILIGSEEYTLLLANQTIMVHNIKHKDDPKDLLTEELVELLTAPADLALYKAAITEALYRGTVLNKELEEQKKKVERLRSALENAATSFGENDRRTQNWQIQLNNTEAALNDLQKEVDENNEALEKAKKGIRAKVAKGSLAVSDKTSIAVVGVQRDGALTDDMVVLQIFGNAVGFTPILKGWAYFDLLLRSRSSFFLFISLPRIVATSA